MFKMTSHSSYRFPFAQYPAIRLSILLISGILLSNVAELKASLLALIVIIITSTIFLLEWRNKRWMNINISRLNTALFLCLILLFGWARTEIDKQMPKSITVQTVHKSPWMELIFSAEILQTNINSKGKQRADVIITKTQLNDESTSQEKYKARLLLNETQLMSGDSISFLGTVIPISEKRNPHQFDYKKYLADREIYVQIRLDSLTSRKSQNSPNTWNWWRLKAQSLVDQNFSEETAPIAKALLLGYKQDLEAESKQAFARAGLSHIMAVSGLHVGFIIAPFWVIIPFFWSNTKSRFVGLFLLIIILYGYAALTGFSASVIRASVMAGLLSYGKLFNKSPNTINLTGVAALVLLLWNPRQIFEVGFQLSFSAVLIILFILPVIQNKLPYWLRIKWYGKPLMIVIVSLVVQFGLLPIQVYYFGEISIISPLSNALFVPLLGVIVPISLFGLLISAVAPSIGAISAIPADQFLKLMSEFVIYVSGLDWAWIKSGLMSTLLFPCWVALIGSIASWRTPALRWKWFILSLSLMVTIQAELINKRLINPDLHITIFDVGQGDAALIKSPNGKYILIDAGVWSPSYNSGSAIIIPHLKAAGINKLDAIILSHPHADHIGGILSLIEEVEIDTIYNSGYVYGSRLYERYIQEAQTKKIPLVPLKAGDYLNLDPALLLLVLGPEGGRFNDDPNQHSVIINMIYRETEILFTGDAGENQELRLIENYGDLLDTDVLKVGHHGSRTSSEFEFLALVTPNISVVSLAEKNKFKHPHHEAVHRIQATGTALYFTSRDKALHFVSDGTNIWHKPWD